MKNIFISEVKRAYDSYSFRISFLIGMILSISHFLIYVIPKAVNPLKNFVGTLTYPASLYECWIGGALTPIYSCYLTIFPIIASIAYSLSLRNDYKTGYIKQIIVRTGKKNYLTARYITNFVIGGLVVTIPIIVNYLLTAAVLPALNPIIYHGIKSSQLLGDLFPKNPLLCVLIYFFLYFIYGGCFASLPLIISYFIDNYFVLSLSSFGIWYLLGITSRLFISTELKNISPSAILNISSSYCTWEIIIAEIVIITLLTFGGMLYLGGKNDVI